MNETEFIDKIKNILNEDCIVRLRKIDPRVSHYELYVKLTNADINEIKKMYPKVKIEYGIFGHIKSVTLYGIEGFTIYNIDGNKRKKLIQKHESAYKQTMDTIRKNNIIF